MQIVPAAPEHLDSIARIYAAIVGSSPATFDLEAPSIESWERALAAVDPGAGRFLIVAIDDHGKLLGYAKSGQFRERAAYDSTCETSIYVDEAVQGRGVGRRLYQRLLELLEASPLRLAVAAMTDPNPASAALHEGLGFERVGTFTGVGFKFGRPWDVTWYQRSLSGPTPSPEDGP